ncbi:MAG: hypothetical protein MHM6MM_007866 [Cercozoa sp. M6MM]
MLRTGSAGARGLQRRFRPRTSERAKRVVGPHFKVKKKPGMKPNSYKLVMTHNYRDVIHAGELAQVNRGFARKLLREGMAVPATLENIRRYVLPFSELAKFQQARQLKERLRKMRRLMRAIVPVPTVKKNSDRLYFPITLQRMVELVNGGKAAEKYGLQVTADDIDLPKTISTVGEYAIPVRVMGEFVPFTINVVADRNAVYANDARAELIRGGIFNARGRFIKHVNVGEDQKRISFFGVALPSLEEQNLLHLSAANDVYVRRLQKRFTDKAKRMKLPPVKEEATVDHIAFTFQAENAAVAAEKQFAAQLKRKQKIDAMATQESVDLSESALEKRASELEDLEKQQEEAISRRKARPDDKIMSAE